MCCSDPDSVPAALDYDPVIWLRSFGYAGWFREGPDCHTMIEMGGDCDGLTRSPFLDFSKGILPVLTNVHALTEDEERLFDDTPPLRPIPPEKIAAAKKAIGAITARKKGLAGIEWPPMWIPSAVYPGYRIGPHGIACLPNTEPGRRAAWELEGS